MREKLETRSLAELKEMAKNVGLKGPVFMLHSTI